MDHFAERERDWRKFVQRDADHRKGGCPGHNGEGDRGVGEKGSRHYETSRTMAAQEARELQSRAPEP